MHLASSGSSGGELEPAGMKRTHLPPFSHPISPTPSSDKLFLIVSGDPEELVMAGGHWGPWLDTHSRRRKNGRLLARTTHSFICLSPRSLRSLPTHLACYLIGGENARMSPEATINGTAFAFLSLFKNKSIVRGR